MPYNRSRWEFDGQRFARDLRKVCAELGTTVQQCNDDLGIDRAIVSNLERIGRIPSGRVLVALAAWAGLNLNEYLIDFEDSKMPAQAEKPYTFRSALERIKQLEEELKRASQQA